MTYPGGIRHSCQWVRFVEEGSYRPLRQEKCLSGADNISAIHSFLNQEHGF